MSSRPLSARPHRRFGCRPSTHLFLLFLANLGTQLWAAQIESQHEPLPVLLISGENNHDWEWTVQSLEEILGSSGLFDVTVSLDPARDLADPDLLAGVRAVVLDWNGTRWGTEAEEAFVQAVDNGLGVSVIHAADNAFEGWNEYEAIVGHLWRKGTGHGSFHPFRVNMIDRDHPVSAQFSDLRDHPDELYHRLVNTQGVSRRILAHAFSAAETGGTGAFEPMILVGRYGAGRVFHTPLGHVWRGSEESRSAHADPQFRQLVVRGTEWAASGHVSDFDPDAGVVPAEWARMGWRSLFGGKSTDAWRGLGQDGFPSEGWRVVDRCLVHTAQGGGGDLISTETFADFELHFEFQLTPGANSGIKIGIPSDLSPGAPALGPEFQILDDASYLATEAPAHLTGSIYDIVAAPLGDKLLHPPGRWNRGRITRQGNLLEHRLNGRLVARIELGSKAWREALANSKFKDRAEFGLAQRGHILLQDHGDEIWFRNLFVRELPPAGLTEQELFNGRDLTGWHPIGDAVFEVDGESVVGRIGGGGQSFLVSDEAFGDFLLEVELKNEEPGNSGLQFRSHVDAQGHLFGYQMEIDPSDRAWSGGLFDEYRRAWLDDLADNPAGRAAFRRGAWNTYRIEANGPWLRAWVNGVATMDHVDPLDAEGHFALQVHQGTNTRMRWKNFRLAARGPAAPRALAGAWGGPPGLSHCPLGRGEDHEHVFMNLSVTGSGRFSMRARRQALRVGLARTLLGGSLGMASGTPGFRSLPRLSEGALLFDETLAFTLFELEEANPMELSATFLDDRITLHRGGDLILDRHVPPSRWGDSLQLFQCLAPQPQAPESTEPRDADSSAASGFPTWWAF